jgi:hypothetical protein
MIGGLAYGFAAAGRKKEAEQLMELLISKSEKHTYLRMVSPTSALQRKTMNRLSNGLKKDIKYVILGSPI